MVMQRKRRFRSDDDRESTDTDEAIKRIGTAQMDDLTGMNLWRR